jgi:two-component system NtrC family sensor kinase
VPNGVRIELSLGGVPAVNGSEGELEQVFVNLVANALDAVGDEGRVGLRTSADRDRVRVRVADDGPGVPPENLHRVFEPFFTTKPVGQGTGVGLSLSYAIVRRHGGALEVASEPGCGAIFTVTLPRADFNGGRSLNPAAN